MVTNGDAMPTLSVVTVVFNAASTIEATIRSVREQEFPCQYIVIDGGSTDGTTAILQKHCAAGGIDHFVSERDSGISDALNKGIALATGTHVGIIHADDTYLPGALAAVADAARRTPGAVIHGDMVLRETGETIRPRPCPSLWKYVDFPYNHVAMFVPAAVYREVGGYDTRFRLAMDYDFCLRATKRNVPFMYIPRCLTRFSLGGASTANPRACHREVLRSQLENGLFPPACLATFALKMAVNGLKGMVSLGR